MVSNFKKLKLKIKNFKTKIDYIDHFLSCGLFCDKN